ncbi:MAG TPA: hypothetical protein VK436_07865 [Methanocella sp.]|nr:hypothetical protein [Methanocella sp.]
MTDIRDLRCLHRRSDFHAEAQRSPPQHDVDQRDHDRHSISDPITAAKASPGTDAEYRNGYRAMASSKLLLAAVKERVRPVQYYIHLPRDEEGHTNMTTK